MITLPDTGLWIALTRSRSPRALKAFVAPYINNPNAALAEPIVFELLRNATDPEAIQLTHLFQSLPLLAGPPSLWSDAVQLGRRCRAAGLSIGSIDLLIATTAIHHDAQLITFDTDFPRIAAVSKLRARLLKPPSP